MAQVFISYARETEAAARMAAEALQAHGHSAWFDEQLPAHRDYAEVISDRLDSADAVLVIWSEAASRSQWVRAEANRARERGRLVQSRIDETRLPLPFDQIQCVDLRSWRGNLDASAWQAIVASIDALSRAVGESGEQPRQLGVSDRSLAVMPFKDLSPAKDQDYFCEGIGEEILMALARLPGLKVASSTATPQTSTPLANAEIARALRVKAFLEGSVRKASERARVAVRLIETGSGFTIWAETFDRDLGDIFALQEEIARSVVAALGVKLVAADDAHLGQGGTSNSEAYDFYLKAKHLVRMELEPERRRAAELFREAIRRDPGFALAYAGLADVLAELARQHPDDWSKAAEEAVRAAGKAVELSPDLADAHLALGAALRLSHDPGAAAEYERAVELNPHDANVHYRFAKFLVLEGEKRRAIEHYERAFALAPDDYRYVVYTLQEYQALGDKEGERSALERAWPVIEHHLKVNPDDVRAMGHGSGVLALLGRSDDCHEFIDRALALRPDEFGNLVNLACAAILNDEPDYSLELLERAVATGRGDKEWILQDNDFAPLHGNPRFEALVARMS
jgi:adenylate cyclase